nr:MAG TPA: hypothetical protein [Caudoviricetes sp.]
MWWICVVVCLPHMAQTFFLTRLLSRLIKKPPEDHILVVQPLRCQASVPCTPFVDRNPFAEIAVTAPVALNHQKTFALDGLDDRPYEVVLRRIDSHVGLLLSRRLMFAASSLALKAASMASPSFNGSFPQSKSQPPSVGFALMILLMIAFLETPVALDATRRLPTLRHVMSGESLVQTTSGIQISPSTMAATTATMRMTEPMQTASETNDSKSNLPDSISPSHFDPSLTSHLQERICRIRRDPETMSRIWNRSLEEDPP